MEISVLLLLVSFLGCIFGVFYLFYVTRHRERMALIQKGEDAGLFYPADKTLSQMRRFTILNISLTFIGIGLGTTLAIFLYDAIGKPAIYPACIFTMSGLGLLISFFMNRKLEDS
jgi:hypothetical protein